MVEKGFKNPLLKKCNWQKMTLLHEAIKTQRHNHTSSYWPKVQARIQEFWDVVMCHWMGGSQHPNSPESWCLQNVTNHSHSSKNTTSHPTTYELSALLLWGAHISQINHMDGIISWTLSQHNAKIFETFLTGSGDCVAYCLQRKQCSIIRWTLHYQYLEIPQTLFHTLTSRITQDFISNMAWFGTLTHKAVIFKDEFLSFFVTSQLWKSIPLASQLPVFPTPIS